MNAKDKPNGSKSTLQSTSHLVVQGNSLVRSFITEMSVNQLKLFTQTPLTNYYLIGNSVRCRLYDYIIRKMMPGTTVTCISNSKTIDRFSIDGMLHIARKAGLVQ